MKYILMCGSNHDTINGTPRQLIEIGEERLLDRTIRLLKRYGIKPYDIAITATDPEFFSCGVEVIQYDSHGPWYKCFMPSDEPTCYLFGDVLYSHNAIRTIINTDTDDIEFFASAPPFHPDYTKPWAEPFAFKVVNQDHFHKALARVQDLIDDRAWNRDPIAWEVWQVVKQTPINRIDYGNYTIINDYTCDIDCEADAELYRRRYNDSQGILETD